jgi:folate-binding Fe-S cluster repair protein YgfZ
MRFEALNGVDFRKGCYIGQEITARMKHKTELRKGLARATLTKQVPLHTPITADGKEIGFTCSQAEGDALIYLRFEKANGTIMANDAVLSNISTDF